MQRFGGKLEDVLDFVISRISHFVLVTRKIVGINYLIMKLTFLTITLCLLGLLRCSVALSLFGHSNNNFSLLCGEKGSGCECQKDVNCLERNMKQIPDGIVFPSETTYVTFSRNRLTEITTLMFLGGPDVAVLDLSHNLIKFVAGDAFFNLKNLDSLDISHNALWNLASESFTGLSKLHFLSLNYNQISHFFSDVFKPISNLTDLNFGYNPMLFIESESFEYMSQLEYLNLENTGISTLPTDIWNKNQQLRTLNLGSNSLKRIPVKALTSAPLLRQLDISQNPIETLEKNTFAGLEKLEVITMNHMSQLSEIKSGAFRGLPSLRELHASDNLKLIKIWETAFATPLEMARDELYEKRSLQKVIMRHNGLKTLPSGLLRWDELYNLDLSENPWNCDCFMAWVAEPNFGLSEISKKTIVCATPPQYANKMVLGMSKNDFVCRYLSPEAVIGLALLVALAFVLAMGGAAFLLYRKRMCNCLLRRAASAHKYTRVVNTKDKVELEWDHGAEPLTSERSRSPSDA